MFGKLLTGAVLTALVTSSFYFYGEVHADPQARLALIQPEFATSSAN